MKQLLAWIAALFGGGKKKPPVIVVPPPPVGKPKLNWPDRRAIGMIMLANWRPSALPPNNGNWFLQGTYDYDNLHSALTQHIDVCIANLKDINAQGAIIWDVEGERYPRSITYIGSPDLLPTLSPEMDAIADEMFARLKSQGLATGVCLRPTVIKNIDTWPGQFNPQSMFETLMAKVDYCKKRWGCTLYYVDSNVGAEFPAGSDNTVGAGRPIPASVFQALNKEYPDCLFIPEWHTKDYDQFTAPLWHKTWGNDMRAGSMAVIDCADTNWSQEDLIKAVKDGHILMGRPWYPAPELELIKAAYK